MKKTKKLKKAAKKVVKAKKVNKPVGKVKKAVKKPVKVEAVKAQTEKKPVLKKPSISDVAKAAKESRIASKSMAANQKPKGFALAYLSLGSNVGDREEYIEQAVFLLGKTNGIAVIKRSSNYDMAAEGGPKQPPYINAVVLIRTKLSPEKLLLSVQDIEVALGREREVEWGPRTIDIDILTYNGSIISEDNLQIPHPLMHERMFVLKPLKEIAPTLIHPVLEKTVETLFDERMAEAGDKYDDELPGFKEIREGTPDDYERW